MKNETQSTPLQPDPTGPNPAIQTLLDQASQARQAGDNPRAHALYIRATGIDPKSTTAWSGRADTAEDVDDAIRSWCTVTGLEPGNENAQSALRDCIQRKLAAGHADAVPSIVSLAKTVAEAGHKPDAYALARRATELDPKYEEAWVWRGGLSDDPEEVRSCLKQALALNPGDRRASAGLEWTQSHLAKKETNAEQLPARSLEATEEGQAALKRGDKARAQELFRQATELDGRNEQAWLWRASTTSEINEALAFVEQALAINPTNESARQAQSWLRVKKLRESAQDTSSAAPAETSPMVQPRAQPKNNRAARIIPLLFLVLALLVLVFALLYMRGVLP